MFIDVVVSPPRDRTFEDTVSLTACSACACHTGALYVGTDIALNVRDTTGNVARIAGEHGLPYVPENWGWKFRVWLQSHEK